MSTYWGLIKYNNDDNHDAYTIGIYSSKKKAVNKLLELLKVEYNEFDDNKDELLEEVDNWFDEWSSDEPPTWSDYKAVIKEMLAINKDTSCELDGLSYESYKITKKQLDK